MTGSVCLSTIACGHRCRNTDIVEWDGSLRLPSVDGESPNIGVAGAFAGMAGGRMMVAGGTNFPDGFPWTGAAKIWYDTLYEYDFSTQEWRIYEEFLPEPLGYGVSIQLQEGVLLIGGNNATGPVKSVNFLTSSNGTPLLDMDRYPDLPVPLCASAGALVNGRIYLAGGVTNPGVETATHTFLMLDLDRLEDGWRSLAPWHGPDLGYAVGAGAGGKFYLFSGRDFGDNRETKEYLDGYRYDPEKSEWEKLPGEYPFMAGTAVEMKGDIWFFGGVDRILPTDPMHPGFPRTLCKYSPETGVLETVCESPLPIPVTTTAVKVSPGIVALASGEEKPGVRTPMILVCRIDE